MEAAYVKADTIGVTILAEQRHITANGYIYIIVDAKASIAKRRPSLVGNEVAVYIKR